MNRRELVKGIYEVGARDDKRRLFDELIPLPDGTSYNAYLVIGSDKTALIDTVDPTKRDVLVQNLKRLGIDEIDYIVSNHAEQDHSGSIPKILELYPDAKVVTNQKCKDFLISLLHIPDEKFITINDGETLSLGDKTLEFILAPWVHWPETMLTYLKEEKILFTCDFLGSHYATEELFTDGRKEVVIAAKRYYAEIMMPFRSMIQNHLEKLDAFDVRLIAPSHGPIHNKPEFILNAYEKWVSDNVTNVVLIPYVSMHGSTKILVESLQEKLTKKGIHVKIFNLTQTDLGELAISLVDAATIVLGSSTILTGPHPALANVVYIANLLRPKTKFASIVGSFGWAETASQKITALIPNLKVEILKPVIVKGLPTEEDLNAIDNLAEEIFNKHKELNLL